MNARKSAIFTLFACFPRLFLLLQDFCGIQEIKGKKKYFTDHHTPSKIYTVLEIQSWSMKCMVCKNFEQQHFIPSHSRDVSN